MISIVIQQKKLKATLKKKIPHLLVIDIFFSTDLEIQENYTRGKVSCLIAASEGKFTLGFTGGTGALNPMTLLNRNTIDHDKSTKNYSISILIRTSSA